MTNVLSLFGGIETGRLIAERLGWKVGNYFSSEIDPYPIIATKKNWKEVIHVGSVTEVRGSTNHIRWGNSSFQEKDCSIDFLIAGSPCQDLSIAKNDGKGLEGDRSKLFFEFVRILLETKPKHFFLENVASMKPIWRDEMTKVIGEALYGTCIGKSENYDTSKQKKLYNYYPLNFELPDGSINEFGPWMLNAGMVSAQNRKRLYWTDIEFSLSDVQELASQYESSPKLKDILEDIPFDALDAKGNPIWKPLDEKYLKNGKIQIPQATEQGYCEPVPGNVVDMTQPESATPRGRLMTDKANTCMTGNQFQLIGLAPICVGNTNPCGHGMNGCVYDVEGKSPTLTTNKGEGTKIAVAVKDKCLSLGATYAGACPRDYFDKSNRQIVVGETPVQYVWRKLTVTECCRLQGLPDDYLSSLSNARAYKAAGNGWQADMVEWILKSSNF